MYYEKLLCEAQRSSVDVYEKSMKFTIKGLYSDNVIWVNSRIPTSAEKACVLAEELGHHHTTVGDILNQKLLSNRKQEKRARNWAYEELVPLSAIVQAHKERICNRFELADHLGVTEDFLNAAINHYKEKFGLGVPYDNYTIYFEPLGVLERFK